MCAAVLLLVIPLGLLCRFVPLGLPYVVVKYGGSFLWAAAVYWSIALIAARLRPSAIAVIAIVTSTLVEFFKRVPSANLDTLRKTFAGEVLLGRRFSYTDIAVYAVAILCAMGIDSRAMHEPGASKE